MQYTQSFKLLLMACYGPKIDVQPALTQQRAVQLKRFTGQEFRPA